MSIPTICPHCGTRVLLGDQARGKRLRCEHCDTLFRIGAEADDDLPPRRQPKKARKKPQPSSVGLVIGGVAAGLFVLAAVGGLAIWLVAQSLWTPAPPAAPDMALQRNVVNQPPANGGGGVPAGGQPGTPGPVPHFAVTLSNPQVVNQFPRLGFTVEYRFNSGRPAPGSRYHWIIESSRTTYEADYTWHELSDQGTLRATGFEPHGDQGPFTMYLEVAELGPFSKKRVSNTVKVEGKVGGGMGPFGPPPGIPAGLPFGPPPGIGPPR
jgi:hypothetical protein